MDENTQYEEILKKLDTYALQNKQLRRANLNKDKTIKHLRRVISKIKEEQKQNQKPHYRNGQKRGAKGRNG